MSAAILDRLREHLDGVLPPGEAPRVLFEALGRWGPRVPANREELESFVRGALTDELESRLQQVPLKRALRAIEGVLDTAEAHTADLEIPIEVDEVPTWRDEVSTKAMRAVAGPVPVLVIAGTSALAIRLRAVLGEDAIDVEARGDLAGVEHALKASPVLAIVDSVDETHIPIDGLADALVHATRTKTIVWGTELAYGRRVIDAADVRGVSLDGVLVPDAFGAILDLIASRKV